MALQGEATAFGVDRNRANRRLPTTFTAVVVALAGILLVAFVVVSLGFSVHHVDLNDGGIWVTNNRAGIFGRMNKPAGAIDALFAPTTNSNWDLDILQDGAAVAAWDKSTNELYPVDVLDPVDLGSTPKIGAVRVSYEEQIAMNGGTLAALDPNGDIRAERVDVRSGISTLRPLDSKTRPLASLGAARTQNWGALAVGADGTVYAASRGGTVVELRPRSGDFAKPRYTHLGVGFQSVQISSVGTKYVILDAKAGDLRLPNGRLARLPADGQATLQTPSPSGSKLAVATTRALISIDLGNGRKVELYNGASGRPARPVRLGDCVYAAWAGTPGNYEHSCNGSPANPGNVTHLGALVNPVFRVNRDSLVLNDLTTGAVLDPDTGRTINGDNWPKLLSSIQANSDNKNAKTIIVDIQNQPPKALPDILGARPGRTTVLHVLDNDSDPGGRILSITSVTPPSDPAAHLSISPDGQTVEIAMPETSGDVHFHYTIDDGANHRADAEVTVQRRAIGENRVPNTRNKFIARTYSVASGGTRSLPVLDDWRDFDGDPVVLQSAHASVGSAITTADGNVVFTAPVAAAGSVAATITYSVSDEFPGSKPVNGAVHVDILAANATAGTAPVAQPDVARGVVGQPITLHPLDNDLAGTDPTDPGAQLTLAGQVASPPGTTVTTDPRSGLVTMVATRPGSYFLSYQAAFGNAELSKRVDMRVDVAPADKAAISPIVMPDQAIVYGSGSTTVDVLANDFDPAGGLLAVVDAAPVDSGELQVAIIKGRWLHITALTPSLPDNRALVRYTVTNGDASTTDGEVTVTQLPRPTSVTPVVLDDYATVRAGDTVTVSVLDNDTDPAGDPLTLAPVIVGDNAPPAGQLPDASASGARGALGSAYVSGRVVRYVAPSSVQGQQSVIVDYVAQDPQGNQATGHIHITVTPEPNVSNPDQPPTPAAVEARTIAGDTITIPIATTGVDPDGDSVTVTGIASAPTLGRVLGVGPNSITYQAFPTSSGTDSFRYVVADHCRVSCGKSGTSTIRISVAQPGDPQPPVAIDDQATAAPNTRLSVDVLHNDLIAPGDTVSIAPLADTNLELGTNVASLTSPTGPVVVNAPNWADGKPLVILYSISDGLAAPARAKLTVHFQSNYKIPPVAVDAFAHPGANATSVRVNLLENATSPDGSSLRLAKVYSSTAIVRAGVATLKVTSQPQVIPYMVEDSNGARAMAVIYVPPVGAGPAHLKAGATISIPKNGSKTVNLADYVVDPSGRPVRLTTTDQLFAAPSRGLEVTNVGAKQLKLVGLASYIGPGAVTVQVTDGTSLKDPKGITGFVTIPVQVGPPTPVLRCPPSPVTIIEGGPVVRLDPASVCHVWTANPADRPNLRFTASWKKSPGGVSIDGSGTHTLGLTASGSAKPGTIGTLEIGVKGTVATPSELSVQVLTAPKPTVAPITIDGFRAGDTAKLDLAGYVTSTLRDPKVSVVDIVKVKAQAKTSFSGSTLSITPDSSSHGTMTFTVTVTDVADKHRPDRQAQGTVTLNVLNVPDAPTNLAPGRTVLSRTVDLSWTAPANNGAPIDYYNVDYRGGSSGSQRCPASPCSITGLRNGTAYTFTVAAHNQVGLGATSGSTHATPDEVPDAVTNLSVSNPENQALVLHWSPAHTNGSPLSAYKISWAGGQATSSASATSTKVTGLENDNQYTFTIVAVNSRGPGLQASVQGQSAGKPQAPGAPSFTAANDTAGNTRVVRVNWNAVDPNGIAPTSYQVNRTADNGTPQKVTCADPTATSCTDAGIALDGTRYTYTITAMNAAAAMEPNTHTSNPGPGTTMEATATPDDIKNIVTHVDASVADGQIPVTFDLGPSHGKSSTVNCTYSGGSCGSKGSLSTAGASGVSMTLSFPASWSGSFLLVDCNGGTQSDIQAGSACNGGTQGTGTANGPPNAPPSGSCAGDNGSTATFTWSAPTPNGRPIDHYMYTGDWNETTTSRTLNKSVAKDGKTHTIHVYSVDSGWVDSTGAHHQEQSLSYLSISCTDPSPPPPPSIAASQGGSTSISGCTISCHRLRFTLSTNFPSGTYSWKCLTNGVVSYDSSAYGYKWAFNAGGTYESSGTSGFCDWGAGTEAIEINGVTSNPVPHS